MLDYEKVLEKAKNDGIYVEGKYYESESKLEIKFPSLTILLDSDLDQAIAWRTRIVNLFEGAVRRSQSCAVESYLNPDQGIIMALFFQ